MKIVFISQYFHPETFSNNVIAAELVERGHEVEVVCCVPNYPQGEFFDGYSNREGRRETWRGMRIRRVWTWKRGKRALSLLLNYLVFPLSAGRALMARDYADADVSFVSMPSPVLQAVAGYILRRRRGVPCVIWVQDLWPESAVFAMNIRNRAVIALLSRLCGRIYRAADLVLVQSPGFVDRIAAYGVDRDRIRVLPNTAPDHYAPVAPEGAAEAGALVPDEGFRLMFAGNIGEAQDFDTLVAAADLLRDRADLTWVIVGSGRDLERARGLVAARGLEARFRFLGRHPDAAMPGFFAHADAMLVSLADIPIFALTVPYKMQGYMACAKPVVASLNGVGAGIVETARCGVAAPASRPEALAGAVRAMMDAGPEARAEMGRNARAWFDAHYGAGKIYGDLERWLAEAAALRKR